MGVLVMRDGIPVELDDRLWSFDGTVSPVAPNAYLGSMTLDPLHVWRKQRAVRMVVGFLARNIAQVSLHAFEAQANGDRKRLPRDAKLSRLLAHPSPTATAYEAMRNLVVDVCLWQRYAARFTLTDDGGAMLVRVPPRLWKFKRDAFDQPEALVTADPKNPDQVKEFPLDDFLWIDGYPCPGEKPLEFLAGLLAEEQESQNYRVELWRSGGRMPGWIKRPAEAPAWSKKAKKSFRDGWRDYASGGDRAGATPILEDGMEYHELTHGITPENAQQLEARKFSLAETAAAFHLPPVFAGLLDHTSHSNVEAYREQLYSDTLGPFFQEIGQAHNARVVHRPVLETTELTFVEFNVQEKLRMSFEQQVKILQTAVGGPYMLRNEARQRVNLPQIEGGDELVVPLNVIEGGQASPTDSAAEE